MAKKKNWVQYNSTAINKTYFVPFFGTARKYYPQLFFCDDQVKLVSYINGEEVVFRESSISDKRTDFDFLSVLLDWRSQYLQKSLKLSKEQVEIWSNIDEDIIALHKLIKIKFLDNSIKDLVALTKVVDGLIYEHLEKYEIRDINTVSNVEVAIDRLHLKYTITFRFKEGSEVYTKNIDAILE